MAFSSNSLPVNYPINFNYFSFTHFKLFTFLHIQITFTLIESIYNMRMYIKNILDFIHSANILSTIPENQYEDEKAPKVSSFEMVLAS